MSTATRRGFIKAATAGTVTMIASPWLSPARTYAANEKVNVACVGVGGMGAGNRQELKGLSNIVALCDADSNTLARAAKDHPQA